MRKILFKDTFINRLEKQLSYISYDSPKSAIKLHTDLFHRIKEIPTHPFSYRKSNYFNDETIRDMIFKGYTIVFRITNEAIEIFGFVKSQNEPTD